MQACTVLRIHGVLTSALWAADSTRADNLRHAYSQLQSHCEPPGNACVGVPVRRTGVLMSPLPMLPRLPRIRPSRFCPGRVGLIQHFDHPCSLKRRSLFGRTGCIPQFLQPCTHFERSEAQLKEPATPIDRRQAQLDFQRARTNPALRWSEIHCLRLAIASAGYRVYRRPTLCASSLARLRTRDFQLGEPRPFQLKGFSGHTVR